MNDLDDILDTLTSILAQPEEQSDSFRHPSVPDRIDVAAIRKRTGLSQPAFAASIGVPLATLRNWERGHRSPQGPTRVLLALLERNPRIVEETLGGAATLPS